MRTIVLFLHLPILLATVAVSQPASHPFFPMAEGNVWIHDVYSRGVAGGHLTTTITGWEGEGDDAYWRASVAFEPFGSGDGTEAECSFRIVEQNGNHYLVVGHLSGTGCPTFELAAPGIPLPAAGEPTDVWLTGQLESHAVGTTTAHPPWDAPGVTRWHMIENVGILSRRWDNYIGGGFRMFERLAYASVGGTAYGVPPADFYATADPMQHMPLQIGNEWAYEVTRYEPGLNISYQRHIAISGFDSSTSRYTATVTDHFPGGVEGPYACSIWVDVTARLMMSGNSACSLGSDPSPDRWSHYHVAGAAVAVHAISGIAYELTSLAFTFAMAGTAYDNRETVSYSSAHGVGMLTYARNMHYVSAGFHVGSTFQLMYARVGEHVYGVNPTGSDDSPVSATPLSIFPNPAAHRATLRLPTGDGTMVTIEAFDILGRKVFQFEAATTADQGTEVSLEVAGLAPGVYFVRTSGTAGTRQIGRLVISR